MRFSTTESRVRQTWDF